MSLTQRRLLVDPTAPGSLRQQCQWLGLHRSAYYYQPKSASKDDLALMRLLDEQYLETPQYGYRKMRLVLEAAGYVVNHKRVRRLMQTMGIEAIYPKVNSLNTSTWAQNLSLSFTRVSHRESTSGMRYRHYLYSDGRRVYVLDGYY